MLSSWFDGCLLRPTARRMRALRRGGFAVIAGDLAPDAAGSTGLR
jgi:hypothetical protein